MKIFGLESSLDGARRLAAGLGLELSAHEERAFEDGEFKVRPLESVRRERVVLYHSLAGDAAASANDKLMRALVFAGALKDAGATEVTLVAPYLAFARKDRRTKSRDPLSLRYVAQMVEAVGIDEIVTCDVHNPAAFENAFRCRARNVPMARLFVDHFAAVARSSGRVVVVSPDAGGVKRARHFADLLEAELGHPTGFALVEKYRSAGIVTGDLFAGDVRDADVIIVDDIISGGTTMRRAASIVREHGARSVHLAATHGVFAPEAAAALDSEAIASVVVTDTIDDAAERGSGLSARLAVCRSAGDLVEALD